MSDSKTRVDWPGGEAANRRRDLGRARQAATDSLIELLRLERYLQKTGKLRHLPEIQRLTSVVRDVNAELCEEIG